MDLPMSLGAGHGTVVHSLLDLMYPSEAQRPQLCESLRLCFCSPHALALATLLLSGDAPVSTQQLVAPLPILLLTLDALILAAPPIPSNYTRFSPTS
jgi:hypothetical protein